MRYSNENLTNDNLKYEVEKLQDLIGLPYSSYDNFVECLDDTFSLHTHCLGFEEWESVASQEVEDKSNQSGKLAYEFGNGFVVLNFNGYV